MSFLKHIFEQDMQKTKRITNYMYVRNYRRKYETMLWLSHNKNMRLKIFNHEFTLLAGKIK